MRIEKFEDIQAWQKAKELTKMVYFAFAQTTDFGFRDQIQRAAVSIMNNIAERFERQSDNEFKYFFNISKGSCGEVRSMLVLALELNKITQSEFDKMYNNSVEISKMLSNLIKYLSQSK